MSQFQTLVFGALFILAGVAVANAAHPARAMNDGPYTIMQHSNTTANAGVFRLDTTSGAISYCYVTPNVDLICTKEVR